MKNYSLYMQCIMDNCIENKDKQFLIYENDKRKEKIVNGRELKMSIENYAFELHTKLREQDRVLIVLPQGLEFVYSLLGCWFENITAIPTAIIENGVKEDDLVKLITYSEDSASKNIISNTIIIEKLKSLDEFKDFVFINVDEISTSLKRNPVLIKSKETDLALLMYTSGSTSKPKGVMLTHKNVMNQALAQQWRIDSNTRMVTWIPQFHAFGLYNNILVPLLKNALSVIISPELFIKEPTYFFELIKKHGGTHTAMPNFAFDYCSNNVETEGLSLDALCTLKAIVSAGEPIRIESYQRFEKKFESIGLKKDVLCPMLGMSELCPVSTKRINDKPQFVTLDIELLEKGVLKIIENHKNGKKVVSCGPVEEPDEIVIVDPETKQQCSKNQIGEVWIKSLRKGSGYWNNQVSTEESFHAKLKEKDEATYFRTGDNGFVYENQLFIVGRCKEIIIVNGKKYHQVDIEWTIKNSIPELSLSTCVFSCEIENSEKVIVVQEVGKNMTQKRCNEISKRIVESISKRFSIEVYEVNLVEEGQIPKTGSGKIQKKESIKKYNENQFTYLYRMKKNKKNYSGVMSDVKKDADIIVTLRTIFAKILGVNESALREIESIAELNINSIENIQIAKNISEHFKIEFEPFTMFQFSNLQELGKYIVENMEANNKAEAGDVNTHMLNRLYQEEITIPEKSKTINQDDIAIIGISCDFPGDANNCKLFWDNIIQHKDCIKKIEDERPCIILDYYRHNNKDEFRPQWGGFIRDINKFDSSFFGISNIEAECMDPQQRKALEMAWNVIEDAGYSPKKLSGKNVGVYIGVHNNDYAELLLSEENAIDTYGGYADSGVHMSLIANRISRLFNFHGPSEIVNTACSSSLVAIHNAVEALKRKECKVAIAGGINIILSSRVYVACEKAGMLSQTGKCKTFDQSADGFVRAEGCGGVLLKPYSEALNDNDNIYGIIKGSGVNHDGTSSSLRAPNMQSQKKLIKSVYEQSKIPFNTISYIETHGTGTALGDPIEIKALTEAALEMGVADKKHFCGIGSVKTNIGHTEAASGVAGLIKVLMAMKYKILPGITNMINQNTYIHLEDTPFYIVRENQRWEHLRDKKGNIIPRRAGISSFGFGGTNAHIIVEEPSDFSGFIDKKDDNEEKIMILSAKTKEALKMEAEQLLEYLKGESTDILNIYDLSYTLQSVRGDMKERWGVSVRNLPEFIDKLSEYVLNDHKTKNDLVKIKKGEDSEENYEFNNQVSDNFVQQCIKKKRYKDLITVWKDGATINWNSIFKERKDIKKLHLPTYPFQKKEIWLLGKNPYHRICDISNKKICEENKEKVLVDKLGDLKEREINHLKRIFSQISKCPIDEIRSDIDLEEYGIDSILIKKFSDELENELGSIPVSIFFEYRTIEDLAEYILKNYEDKVKVAFDVKDENKHDTEVSGENQKNVYTNELSRMSENTPEKCDIAIIGVSGKYPKADDLDELWENLKQGRSCIEEIPSSRWDWRENFDKDKMKAGKINSKWGGFVKDVDTFDPLFFNISPQEAERMDPQERLFLQCVYNTIEDAGYTRDSLKKYKKDKCSGNVGVFVGATFSDYHLYGIEEQLRGNMVALSGSNASIANRVSYYFDFTGPSISVDTMCSSSLTAIHLACNSIKQNECGMAIAGGVNLSLHPNKYLFLSQHNFLSNEGRCDSFGDRGNGYVPGEGVGSILLKRLSDAIEDGDHIYGVIKATAVNHGGKTNGFYVPNPAAQASVIGNAISNANLNPENISYIEAHGTGTELGDPIEIAGLTKAFRKYTDKNMYCSIGSIKSNIGHLEAAAGIAAVTKVLLQLKNQLLVPSLHSEKLNTKIDFKNTPFKVQNILEKWESKNGMPLIAGISSFGAGGSNSHIIIQEYKEEANKEIKDESRNTTALIVLSARDEKRLKRQAMNLLNAIKKNNITQHQLRDVEYTLQVGREAMKERIAFTANSVENVVEKLSKYISNDKEIDEFYYNTGKTILPISSILKDDNDFLDTIRTWYKRGKYSILLKLWVGGLDIDWAKLYLHGRPKKISLNGYSFAKERYWLFDSRKELTAGRWNESSDMDNKKGLEMSISTNSEYSEALYIEALERVKDNNANNETDFEEKIVLLVGFQDKEIENDYRNVNEGASVYSFNNIDKSFAEQYEEYSCSILLILKNLMRNKRKTLIQMAIPRRGKNRIFTGLESMLKTAIIENPEIAYQTIEIQNEVGASSIGKIINKLTKWEVNRHYVLMENNIYERKMKRSVGNQLIELPWKENGVYLFTGGMGKLSQIFVKEIITHISSAKIILLGRSELDEKRKGELNELRRYGGYIEYKKIDIAEEEDLEKCVSEIVNKYGTIHGILHTAGIIRDKLILNKTGDDLSGVYRPKVKGLISLDNATKKIKLDFIALFSSGAAEMGSIGQADYAAANGFMDAYCVYRNSLVKSGKRSGRMISINWPLWKNGGMRVNEIVEKALFRDNGMVPINTKDGIRLFYQALQTESDHIMVMAGNLKVIENKLPKRKVRMENCNDFPVPELDEIVMKLKEIFSEITKLNIEQIDKNEYFESYGIDSVMLTLINHQLSKYFEKLSPTILYEYNTLANLAKYLILKHKEECGLWIKKKPLVSLNVQSSTNKIDECKGDIVCENRKKNMENCPNNDSRIAIIGASGRFPNAENLHQYFENLVSGKKCISEIESTRWKLKDFYISDKSQALEKKRSYSKWGGFLEGFYNFDSLFFNVAPADARYMDPQERIFMEECWRSLEDAGYMSKRLNRDLRRKTGVYGAITNTGYESWNNLDEKYFRTSFSSMVNRFSYFMDFQGPSLAFDTMCSSSLVALHEACEDLKENKIKMAVVGAVNLYLHPNNYINLCHAGLISDSDSNSVFEKNANGFVPSEGVGAVVLKRMDDAIKDKDNILAIISGSAISHSGRTSGYCIPDPAKQAAVMEMAVENAHIEKDTIQHIELAANGSSLVDCVEMSAIEKVFKQEKMENHYTLGNVKTLIGHGESVSGMAQLLKCILMLDKKIIFPMKPPKELNPDIDLRKIPFDIAENTRTWERIQDYRGEIPRRAIINSFGSGGVYASLVLEEHLNSCKEDCSESLLYTDYVFVFSAKTQNALSNNLKQWIVYLQNEQEIDLKRIAYILQTRRMNFKKRFATIANSKEQLISNIKKYLSKIDEDNNFSTDLQEANNSTNNVSVSKEGMNIFTMAKIWASGQDIDWNVIYGNYQPYQIFNLPTYQFDKKKYWVNDLTKDDNLDNNDFISLGEIARNAENVSQFEEIKSENEGLQLSSIDVDEKTEDSPDKNLLRIKEIVGEILFIDEYKDIDEYAAFRELGMDSLYMTNFINRLNEEFSIQLDETVLFEHTTINEISKYLYKQMRKREE